MRLLVVGGTGLIGGHAALFLRAAGHEVTIAARRPPAAATPLAGLPFLAGDYVAGDLGTDLLSPFDGIVFAAGNDPRHAPDGDLDAHWRRANVDGIPRFFAAARDAGVRHAILVGSFYPQVAPGLVEKNAYVRSRHLADQGARALGSADFRVVSINPPFIIGAVPGLVVRWLRAVTRYAAGLSPGMPRAAPPGGVNIMSVRSLSQAILGALLRGEPGRAYLVGDENLTFQELFARFFRAAGDDAPVPVVDREHPLLRDDALLFGRGNCLFYPPDAAQARLLGVDLGDVTRAIAEVVAQYLTPRAS